MIIFITLLVFLILYKCTFCKTLNKQYLSLEHTKTINGIFIALVFMSHFAQYLPLNGVLDKPYVSMQKWLGQLIVTTFMFYSGYGLMESIRNKGQEYVVRMPLCRIVKTLLHFDVAVLFYLIIKVITNTVPAIGHCFQAFFAYKSLGNSDWYIFAIITLWIAMNLVCQNADTSKWHRICVPMTIIVICLMVFLRMVKPTWWYDTMPCFVLGVYWSYFKEKIDALIAKKSLYFGILGFLIVCVISLKHIKGIYMHELWILLSITLFVLLSARIQVKNPILYKLGENLFEIYILMRIPMILLKPYLVNYKYIFFVACAVITWGLVLLFKQILQIVDRKLQLK